MRLIRSHHFSIILLLACCSACGQFRQADRVPRGWLALTGEDARADVFGAWAEVQFKSPERAAGELIAVSNDSVYLLPPSTAVLQSGPYEELPITAISVSTIVHLDTWLTVGHRVRFSMGIIARANSLARFPAGLPSNCQQLRAKPSGSYAIHHPEDK